jgi:hypothetical protein
VVGLLSHGACVRYDDDDTLKMINHAIAEVNSRALPDIQVYIFIQRISLIANIHLPGHVAIVFVQSARDRHD